MRLKRLMESAALAASVWSKPPRIPRTPELYRVMEPARVFKTWKTKLQKVAKRLSSTSTRALVTLKWRTAGLEKSVMKPALCNSLRSDMPRAVSTRSPNHDLCGECGAPIHK